MRCLGLLLLGLVLNGCVTTHTSPLFLETRDETVRILRYCDPDGDWEVVAPTVDEEPSGYALPNTQLIVLRCDVRDVDRFLGRAKREFEQFLLERGGTAVWLRHEKFGAQVQLSWKYEYGGREGLVTLWATPDDDRIREAVITIHESRKAQ